MTKVHLIYVTTEMIKSLQYVYLYLFFFMSALRCQGRDHTII